jgi:hypothetical protein
MTKKILLSMLIIANIVSSCKETQNEVKNENTVENSKDPNLEKLENEASSLRAGGSIKSIELNKDVAKICYVKDYSEYKKINPDSGLSEDDLKSYWESGDAIQKALVDGSVKIMKKLDYVNEVEIILPYQGKTYSIIVSKNKLEKFIGSDFKSIINDWDNKFSNPYVYNDNGRDKFFNEFGKVE